MKLDLLAAGAIVLALLCGCSRDTPSPAAGTGPHAVVSTAPGPANPAPFLSATDCFAPWPTYDAWIERIRSHNPWWKPKLLLLPFMFPRERFERGQAELDCRGITYESDGLEISGWMVLPKGRRHARLPVLIYNRGGNGSFGALRFPLVMNNLFPYAHRGFLVLASQYRGLQDAEPGRFGTDQFGGDDVRDVVRLIELARRMPQADPDNIFVLGASRGGMMSFMTARQVPDIRAMAVIAGVADLKAELAFRPEMEQVYLERIPGYRADPDGTLAQRSVLAWADELPADMPVLLLHGDQDERVDVTNATRLHRRLDELGHPNRLVIYAGDDHFLSDHREQAVDEVVGWFEAAMAEGGHAGTRVGAGR